MRLLGILTVLCAFSIGVRGAEKKNASRQSFVSITELDPSIIVEARYFGEHNFIGKVIEGYEANKCLLARAAAKALAEAQKVALKRGYSLKVYDCYRPQRAVDHFVEWAKDLDDKKMKAEFYPDLEKSKLFSLGYIASKSGHSRGSTVDLTLVKLPASDQPTFDPTKLVDCRSPKRYQDNSVDMGTGYDCFDELSHTSNPKISDTARDNRKILKQIMEEAGFKNYSKEWWHYSLKAEPYPSTYFNFPVK